MDEWDQGVGEAVLIVTDDPKLAGSLADKLIAGGFVVDTVGTGTTPWRRCETWRAAAVLLDSRATGSTSGLTPDRALSPAIRDRCKAEVFVLAGPLLGAHAHQVPLMLRLDGATGSRRDALALQRRLQAALRRPSLGSAASIAAPPGWTYDGRTRWLHGPDQRQLKLTESEGRLWAALIERPGQPVDRNTLSLRVRGVRWEAYGRAVDVLIARLRRRIGDDARRPQIILTVRNRGYMVAADG